MHPEIQLILDSRYAVPDDLAQPASQAHLLSLGEVVDGSDPGMVLEWNLHELYHGATEEMRAGVSVRMGQIVVVGRKPCSRAC